MPGISPWMATQGWRWRVQGRGHASEQQPQTPLRNVNSGCSCYEEAVALLPCLCNIASLVCLVLVCTWGCTLNPKGIPGSSEESAVSHSSVASESPACCVPGAAVHTWRQPVDPKPDP